MASPLATESPTINRAWEAFVLHVPAILLAWIAAMGISVIGMLVYFVISLVLTTLSGADPNGGGTVLAITLGQLGQLPFTVLSSLVGVLLAAIPALLQALPLGTTKVLIVAGLYFVLNQVAWNVIAPMVMGRSVNLSAASILIAILIGGGLAEKLGQDLADRIAEATAPWVLQADPDRRFVVSGLGDDAGIVGAASLARDRTD